MSGFANNGVQNPDLWGLLTLMADTPAYEAKIREIHGVEQRLDARIALAGEASQILELREAAIKSHETAIEKLTAAEKRAREIIQLAEDTAKAKFELVYVEIDALRQQAQKLIDDAKAESTALIAAQLAQLDEQKAQLANTQKDIQKQEKAADKKLAHYAQLLEINQNLLAKNSAQEECCVVLIAKTQQLRFEALDRQKSHQELFARFLDEHSKANADQIAATVISAQS